MILLCPSRHPEGYDLEEAPLEAAGRFASESGGSFRVAGSMEEAFEGADIIYPKSWAPAEVMRERTRLLRQDDRSGLDDLEARCLSQNAEHKGWEADAEKVARTRDGSALYMHCLPADISGVSCEAGEVSADVFERARIDTYHEASHKPFVIAAMVLATRFDHPAEVLRRHWTEGAARRRG